MSRKSYATALGEVLAPLGFERDGRQAWSRMAGTVLERVDLQTSQIGGTTANLGSWDLATEELLRQAIAPREPFGRGYTRIGMLMDGRDRWWKNDPNGPVELAAAVALHAPAFFESRRSIDAQLRRFGRGQARWTNSNTASRFNLAITLYRIGEIQEACDAIKTPPRTIPKEWVEEAESIRKWLGCGLLEPPAAAG